MWFCFFFFFKQKTAYEISVRDWSSDVCSSDLSRTMSPRRGPHGPALGWPRGMGARDRKSVVSGKSVNACVDLGGRRKIKKKQIVRQPVQPTRKILLALRANDSPRNERTVESE